MLHDDPPLACLQAPVPYLNRALAEEQLGVEADARSDPADAQQHYEAAIQVCARVQDLSLACTIYGREGPSEWSLKVQDCRAAQSRDAKEFAAYFNEGNVQVMKVPNIAFEELFMGLSGDCCSWPDTDGALQQCTGSVQPCSRSCAWHRWADRASQHIGSA